MINIKKILKWGVITISALYIGLVLVRIPHFYNLKKTQEQVAKIHATKLTLDDVMGKNLPPDPRSEADKTVQGVDANQNGIRDDVELAIFKEYPDSAKTRAVLLQYALALQMEMTQSLENTGTVGAVAEKVSIGYLCVGKIVSREDMSKYIEVSDNLRNFVETIQLNTENRKEYQENFYKNLKSGEVPRGISCDIDINSL